MSILQQKLASSRSWRSCEPVANIDIFSPLVLLNFFPCYCIFLSIIRRVLLPDARKRPSAELSTGHHGCTALEGSPAQESF